MPAWPDYKIIPDSISYEVKPFSASTSYSTGRVRERAIIGTTITTYTFDLQLDTADNTISDFISFIRDDLQGGANIINDIEINGEIFDAELVHDSVKIRPLGGNGRFEASMSVRTLTRDWAAIDNVLSLVMDLGSVDIYYATYPPPTEYDPPDPFDPSPSITWPADNLKTENLAISYLRNLTGWQYLHSVLGALTKVDDSGAMGPNQAGLKAVRYQREAIWLNRNAFTVVSASFAERCALAMSWSFARQNSTFGWFHNGVGAEPLAGIESDIFFMNGHLQAHLVVAREPSLAGLLASYNSLVTNGRVGLAMSWLYNNSAQVLDDGEETPNRLLFASAALETGAIVLSNANYRTQAKNVYFANATDALRYNSGTGQFIEKGGPDTSYQAVSLMNLATLFFHTTDSTWRTSIKTVITAAANWLASKIVTADPIKGYISDVGNTRTNNVLSRSPEAKQINYPEAALAMFYAGFIVNSLDHINKAITIVQYAANAGSRNPVTNFTRYFTSVLAWTLTVTNYWAGGSGQSAQIDAQSWANGFRPVRCRIKIRATSGVSAFAWLIKLVDTDNALIATFTNSVPMISGQSLEITETILWVSADIDRIVTADADNSANVPDLLEIHFLMN